MRPPVEVQRRVLETKHDILLGRAYEHELNAVLNQVQIPTAAGKQETEALIRGINTQNHLASQFRVAAEKCREMIEALGSDE